MWAGTYQQRRTTMKVRFSCEKCGLVDTEADVRERRSGEDIMHWIEEVMMVKIARRHAILSLMCEPKSLQNVKIPTSEKGVGFLP